MKAQALGSVLAALLLASLRADAGSQEDAKRDAEAVGTDLRPLPPGTWGGDHVGMEVTAQGARLDYDCAHGTIDETIAVDEKGRFGVAGTYVREGPGPTRPEGQKGESARYIGEVDGDTMKLTVTLAASGQPVGSFTLVRGRMPRIQKCG